MQFQVPFGRAEFAELDHLVPHERKQILERCINSNEMAALSRQHMLAVRIALLVIPIGIVTVAFRETLGIPLEALPWVICFVIVFLVVGFVASLVVYMIRSSKRLHRLVAQEMESRS